MLSDDETKTLSDGIFGVLQLSLVKELAANPVAVKLIPNIAAALTPALPEIVAVWASAVLLLASEKKSVADIKSTFLANTDMLFERLAVDVTKSKAFIESDAGKDYISKRLTPKQ